MSLSHPSQAHRLPQIYIQSSQASDHRMIPSRSGPSASRSSAGGLSSSDPMSIPSARDDDYGAPPPLPPPRFISDIKPKAEYSGGSGPWPAWNPSHQQSWGKESIVRSGSSLYGSFSGDGNGITDGLDTRRGSSVSTIKSISEINGHQNSYPRADEGYASLSTTDSMSSSYSRDEKAASSRSGFQSSVHDRYRADTGDYDKGMLSRLDSRRRPDISTSPRDYGRSSISRSLNEAPRSSASQRYMAPDPKPLSLPVRSKFPDNTRWPQSNGYSGAPFTNGTPYNFERRSPSEGDEMERSPRPVSRQNTLDYDDGASCMGRSYNDTDFAMEEAGGLQRLRIDDSMRRSDGYSPNSAAGQKRRASSPLVDEMPQTLHPTNSMSDLRRRRESAASRASPAPSRQHSLHGSVSSTASGPRSNSFSSGPILVPSSNLTPIETYGQRLSPGGLSPGGVSPRTVDGAPPFIPSFTVNNAPYEPTTNPAERVVVPEVRPITSAKRQIESLSQSKNGVLKVQSGFVCDCCPKKPKKFETEEALNAHEAEKQYECAYCKNRFKNKNEAERHQNSLHLRRHSWSCAALSEYADAFHDSSSSNGMLDTCGYCGDEFQRSGRSMHGNENMFATESDWNIRIQHLVDVHKFRECNHTKKFFRADHFRQHLKHSHAGTSGKWTNMLENACMKDEPLPEPIRGPEIVRIGSLSGRVARINEESE